MRAILLAICLFAVPVFAKDAVFQNGLLTLDSIKVGNETYTAQLQLMAGVSPETFVVTSGELVAPAAEHAAIYNGTSLNIGNVLVDGKLRARANFILVGSDPLRFQLSTYSQLRAVELVNLVETLKPGSVFAVEYTGGILDTAKVKLSIGSTPLTANVVENIIASTIPAGVVGAQTLTVQLDGDQFKVPLSIQSSAAIANPLMYVKDQVSLIASGIQILGLPSNLLDVNTINSQMAALTAAEAQIVALQMRENVLPLLLQLQEMHLASGSPLKSGPGSSVFALVQASEMDCNRWMKNFGKATILTGAGVAATAAGLGAGVPGAIVAGVGFATIVMSSEVAIRNMKLIVNECGALSDATFTVQPLLQNEIVLTQAIEVFESRTSTFSLDEVIRLDQRVRSEYLSTAARLKSFLGTAISVAKKIPFISASSIDNTLGVFAADIQTNDVRTVTGEGYKFTIRSISDSTINGSTFATGNGNITFLFDKKNEDIAEGKNIRFTVELYNSTDGISITVPVLMHGASMLEDLRRAAVGDWTVHNPESNVTYSLVILAGGKGYYRLQNTSGSCPNNPKPPVSGFCEYSMSWTITKSDNKYVFNDYGFWHPAYNDSSIVDRTGLTLPLTGFRLFTPGNPDSAGLRYTKL